MTVGTAAGQSSRRTAAAVALVVVLAVAGLWWAKWWPYGHKLHALWGSHLWSGSDLLDRAGRSGAAPRVAGAWSFTMGYGLAVWKALLVAVLGAAAIEALLPRDQIARALARRGRSGGAAAGGLLALPCMMCTCCTAPIAATLRRRGATSESALAFWVGNPVLNPAVLAFLALVAPWPWVATRLGVGLLLVFGVTVLVGRLAGSQAPLPVPPPVVANASADDPGAAAAARRFGVALLRFGVVLIPEYLLAVFAVGLVRGWLLPLNGHTVHWGWPAVLVAAALGCLVVLPTAGEVPVLLALVAAGAGTGVVGALLITLPAISLPSMVMVGRALSWRTTAAMLAGVAACGVLAAGVLTTVTAGAA